MEVIILKTGIFCLILLLYDLMYVVRTKLLRRDWEDIKTSLYAGNALMIIVDLGIVLSWDLK